MEGSSWVLRERSSADRRVVVAMITKPALALLQKIDKPLEERLKGVFGKLRHQRLQELIEILDAVREKIS